MSTDASDRSTEHTGTMKNQLFCPECGRTSPTTGDWVLEVHAFHDQSWLAYRCPACRTIITRRPLSTLEE